MMEKAEGSKGYRRNWRMTFTIYWCLFKICVILMTMGTIIMTSANPHRKTPDITLKTPKFEEKGSSLNTVKQKVHLYNEARESNDLRGRLKQFHRNVTSSRLSGTHQGSLNIKGIGSKLNDHRAKEEMVLNQRRLPKSKVMAPLQHVVLYPPIFRTVWRHFQRVGVNPVPRFYDTGETEASRGKDLRNDLHKGLIDAEIRRRFARMRIFLIHRRSQPIHFAPEFIHMSELTRDLGILLPKLLEIRKRLHKQRVRLAKLGLLQKIRNYSRTRKDRVEQLQHFDILSSKMRRRTSPNLIFSHEFEIPGKEGPWSKQKRKDDFLIRGPLFRYLMRMFLFRPKDFLVKTLKSQREFSRSWVSFGRMWKKVRIHTISIRRKHGNVKKIQEKLRGKISVLPTHVLNEHVNALALMLRRRKRLGLAKMAEYFKDHFDQTVPLLSSRQVPWKRILKESDDLIRHLMILRRLRQSQNNLKTRDRGPKFFKRRLYKTRLIRKVLRMDNGKLKVRVIVKSPHSRPARKLKLRQHKKNIQPENSIPIRKDTVHDAYFKLLNILVKSNESLQMRIVEQEAMVKQLKTTLKKMKLKNSRWRANTDKTLGQLYNAFQKMKNGTKTLFSSLSKFPYLSMRDNNQSYTNSYWIFRRFQVTVIKRRLIFVLGEYMRNAVRRLNDVIAHYFRAFKLKITKLLSYLKPSRERTEEKKDTARFPKESYIRGLMIQAENSTGTSENASARSEQTLKNSWKLHQKKMLVQLRINKPVPAKSDDSKAEIVLRISKPPIPHSRKTSISAIYPKDKLKQGHRNLRLNVIRNIINVYAQHMTSKEFSNRSQERDLLKDVFKTAVRNVLDQLKTVGDDKERVKETKGLDTPSNMKQGEVKLAAPNSLPKPSKFIKMETEKKKHNLHVNVFPPSKNKTKLSLYIRQFTHSPETSASSDNHDRRTSKKSILVEGTETKPDDGPSSGRLTRSVLLFRPDTEYVRKNTAKEPLERDIQMSSRNRAGMNINKAETNKGMADVKQKQGIGDPVNETGLTNARRTTQVNQEQKETKTNKHDLHNYMRDHETFKFKQTSSKNKHNAHKVVAMKTGSQMQVKKMPSFRVFSPWMASSQILAKSLFWLTQAPHRFIAFIRRLEMANIRLRMEVFSRFLKDEDHWLSKKAWSSARESTHEKPPSRNRNVKDNGKVEEILFNGPKDESGRQKEGKSSKGSHEMQDKSKTKENGKGGMNLKGTEIKSNTGKNSEFWNNDIRSTKATKATNKHETDNSLSQRLKKNQAYKVKDYVYQGIRESEVRQTVTTQGSKLRQEMGKVSEINVKNLREQNTNVGHAVKEEKLNDPSLIRKSRSLLRWRENEAENEATGRLGQVENALDEIATDDTSRHTVDPYDDFFPEGVANPEVMEQADMRRKEMMNVGDIRDENLIGHSNDRFENAERDKDDLPKSYLRKHPADEARSGSHKMQLLDKNLRQIIEKQKLNSDEFQNNKNEMKKESLKLNKGDNVHVDQTQTEQIYGEEAQKLRNKLAKLMQLVRANRKRNRQKHPSKANLLDANSRSKAHFSENEENHSESNKERQEVVESLDTDNKDTAAQIGTENSGNDKHLEISGSLEGRDTSKNKKLVLAERDGVHDIHTSGEIGASEKRLAIEDSEQKGNPSDLGSGSEDLQLQDALPFELPTRRHKKPTEADKRLLDNIEKLTYLVLGRHSRPTDLPTDSTEHSGGTREELEEIGNNVRRSNSMKRREKRDVDFESNGDEEDASEIVDPFDILRSHALRVFRQKWVKMRKAAEALHEEVLKALADYSDAEKELRLLLQKGEALATRVIKVTKGNNIDRTMKKADWRAAQRAFDDFQKDIKRQERKIEAHQKRALMNRIHKQTGKMSDAISEQMAFFDGEGEEKVVTEDWYPFGVGLEARENRKANERHRLRNMMGKPDEDPFDRLRGKMADRGSGKTAGFSIWHQKTFPDDDLQDTSDMQWDMNDEKIVRDPDLSQVDNMLQRVISRDVMSSGDTVIDKRIVKRSHHAQETDKTFIIESAITKNREGLSTINGNEFEFGENLDHLKQIPRLHINELRDKLHESRTRAKLNQNEFHEKLNQYAPSKRHFINKIRYSLSQTKPSVNNVHTEIDEDVTDASVTQNTKAMKSVNNMGTKTDLLSTELPKDTEATPENLVRVSSFREKNKHDDKGGHSNLKKSGKNYKASEDISHVNSRSKDKERGTTTELKMKVTGTGRDHLDIRRHKREADKSSEVSEEATKSADGGDKVAGEDEKPSEESDKMSDEGSTPRDQTGGDSSKKSPSGDSTERKEADKEKNSFKKSKGKPEDNVVLGLEPYYYGEGKTIEKPYYDYDFEEMNNADVDAMFDDGINKDDPNKYVKLRMKQAESALGRDLDRELMVLNKMLLKENKRHRKGRNDYGEEKTSLPNLNDILYDRSDRPGFNIWSGREPNWSDERTSARAHGRHKRSLPDSVWGKPTGQKRKTKGYSPENDDYFEKFPVETNLEEYDLDYPTYDDISQDADRTGDAIHRKIERKLKKAEQELALGDVGFQEYANAKGPYDKPEESTDNYIPPTFEDLMDNIDAEYLARYVNKTFKKKFVDPSMDSFFYDHRYDPSYLSLYQRYKLPKKLKGLATLREKLHRIKNAIPPYESDGEIDEDINTIAREIAGKTRAADEDIGYRGLTGDLQVYNDILNQNMDEYSDGDFHDDFKEYQRQLKMLKKTEAKRRGLASIIGTPSSDEVFRRIKKAEKILNKELAAEKRGEDMALEMEMRRQWKSDAQQRIRDAFEAKKAEVAESQAIDDLEGSTMELTKRKLKQFKQEAKDLMKAIKESNKRAAKRRKERLRDLSRLTKEARSYHG